MINPAWNLCSRGRHQSPINLDPSQLVRDMSLDEAPKFTVDKRPISGSLHNTGQALVFRVDSERSTQMPVNITGGPLSYRYETTFYLPEIRAYIVQVPILKTQRQVSYLTLEMQTFFQ